MIWSSFALASAVVTTSDMVRVYRVQVADGLGVDVRDQAATDPFGDPFDFLGVGGERTGAHLGRGDVVEPPGAQLTDGWISPQGASGARVGEFVELVGAAFLGFGSDAATHRTALLGDRVAVGRSPSIAVLEHRIRTVGCVPAHFEQFAGGGSDGFPACLRHASNSIARATLNNVRDGSRMLRAQNPRNPGGSDTSRTTGIPISGGRGIRTLGGQYPHTLSRRADSAALAPLRVLVPPEWTCFRDPHGAGPEH